MAIVEDGKTTLAKGYGLRKLGSPQTVDEHTVFAIGSCGKAFTTTALALLVDEGKLSWGDKVANRLNGFRMYDGFATLEMTIRDLLVHNSGLGLGAGDLMFFPATDLTRQEVVERLRHIQPATSFRSTFRARWDDRRIEDAYVTFSLDHEGVIDEIRMKAISPLADFSFDYHDLLFRPHAPSR